MSANVRKLVVSALLRCEEGAFSNLVMKDVLKGMSLSDRDRDFFTALFLGTLSRQITADWILDHFLKKGVSGLDREVRAILRVGTFQLHWMSGVPVYAAINESVSLCKDFRKASASKLVNAVLRKTASFNMGEIDTIADPVQRLAVHSSVSCQLAGMLLEEYGERAREMLECTFLPGDTFLRVNPLRISDEGLIEKLGRQRASETGLPHCIRFIGSVSQLTDVLDAGLCSIESLPAQTAAAVVGAAVGEEVLDLCSAPGGKTVCLAQAVGPDGKVDAVELYEHRARLVTLLAERLGIGNIEVFCCDGREFNPERLYDRVLCDVPCSGYGELASKPELRNKNPDLSSDLPDLQYQLLSHGAELVKKGGLLTYSTCTILDRENSAVVRRFLNEHPDFAGMETFLPEIPVERLSDYEIRFLPTRDLQEGFYIASLQKIW